MISRVLVSGDGTVIESEATFNTTSLCDMMLYCSDGEDRDAVSVSVTGELFNSVLEYEGIFYSALFYVDAIKGPMNQHAVTYY